MKRLLLLLCAATILTMGATATIQCPIFVRPGPSTITVEVYNGTPVGVQATFAYSYDPNISEDDLLATGDLTSLTVGTDLVDSFDLNCVDAEALILDQANLLVTGGGSIGTTVMYQGLDYFCGQVVIFDFYASDDLFELDVEVSFDDQ